MERRRGIAAVAALGFALGSAARASADDASYLRPTITVEAGWFSESDAWHGESRAVVGDHVGYWYEYAATGGLEGGLALGGAGLVFGRVSAVGSGTQGLDAAGSNFDDRYDERLELEDAYLGWRRGPLEISLGRQKYQIGNGFFMWDGAWDGGERGSFWISPRKAFYSSAIVRFESGPYKLEGVYLKPDDEPFSSTDVVGGNFEYVAGETGTLGVTYLKIVDSEHAFRDGMDFLDWRVELTPLARDRSFSLAAEWAMELNGKSMNSSAWYGEAGYEFDETTWAPFVSYRYAWFAGEALDTPDLELWDPLFYGSNDWSTWYVGEIIGNFVALNRDLAMQTARLRLQPTEALTLQLIYNRYRLIDTVTELKARDASLRAANIHSHHIGQGVDLIGDWTANDHLSFSGSVAAFDPGAGMQQYVEANTGSWWLHFMLYTKVSF